MTQHFYKSLIAIILIINSNYNYAQCTVDATFKTPGVYPTKLPNGRVGEVYNQVLQFYVNKDTTVSGIPATIDSFSIAKINGYPNGISYVCNTLNCTIPGGSNGCLTVSGIPTVKGYFPVQIILKVRAKALGFTQTRYDTINSYSLTINSGVSVNDITETKFNLYPNPINHGELNLEIWNKTVANTIIKIVSMQGVLIDLHNLTLNSGMNKKIINTEQLAKGIYILQIDNGENTMQQKILIE